MEDYWMVISSKHQDKVRNLARTHGVTVERAFRNILRHLAWEIRQVSNASYFEGFITARHVEGMIDTIAR